MKYTQDLNSMTSTLCCTMTIPENVCLCDVVAAPENVCLCDVVAAPEKVFHFPTLLSLLLS